MNYKLLLVAAGTLMLSACGQDDGQTSEQAGSSDEKGEVAASGERSDSGLGYDYVIVDHDEDAKEFVIRRSIAGKEDLVEHYEENNWDTSELKKELKDLKKQLKEFVD